MTLGGNLSDARLAEVLQLLHQEARSGTLRASSNDTVAAILFCNGRIIGASGPRIRRLGELLIEAGVIEEGLLAHALRRQRIERPRLPLGRILVAIGATSEKAIRAAVETQVRETVEELLQWKQGSYEFIQHEIKPVDSISFGPGAAFPRVDVDAENVLRDAARALEERVSALDTGPQPLTESPQPAAVSAAATKAAGDTGPMRAKDWARITAQRMAAVAPSGQAPLSEEIRRIGFYDSIQRDGRSLHVQTEVIGRGQAVVRSTVLEGGTVQYAERQPYPVEIQDLEKARQHVEAQHRRVVERASRGELESR